MAKVKECYKVLINGKQTLVQVTRTEKKEERDDNGISNVEKWREIIDGIMEEYFNTDNWTFIMNDKVKKIKIRLEI